MSISERIRAWRKDDKQPVNLRHGLLGERAAKEYLQGQGMKFLTANFRSERGEIDLIFRADDRPSSDNLRNPLITRLLRFTGIGTDCLVFVEVKARKKAGWTRPSKAVNAPKRLRLTRCAFDYLRLLKNPPIKIRFDVVEVLLEDGEVAEVRHLPNTFTVTPPYRYG
jgi:putative endonuclease